MTTTAVEQVQKRIIEMIEAGCVMFHLSPGHKWRGLPVEEKCAALMQMLDAQGIPLTAAEIDALD